MAGRSISQARKGTVARGGVSRGLGLPLHQQVYLVLRDHILSNRYRRDRALPSEGQLAVAYGVSRITIRTALKALEKDQLILRRQGLGTFISERIPDVPMRVAMRDQRAHIEELARYTKIKLIEFGFDSAPPDVWRWFGSSPSTIFNKVVRVRFAARPVLLLTAYTPEWLGKHFDRKEYESHAHYTLLRRAGIRFETGEQIISATLADPATALHLNVDVGSPLVKMIFYDFDQNGDPIRHLEVLAPPSKFEIHMRVGGGANN
jgi:GntR family transcriptional regulator